MRRRSFAATRLAGPLALLAACASPTLPLPPPLAPTVSPGPDADHVMLTAQCNPSEKDAIIVVVNEGGGSAAVPAGLAVGGALTGACGSWQTNVYAHHADALVITYQLDEEISQPTLVTVP